MKSAVFHPKARDAIREFPEDVRRGLGTAIFDLQKGAKLSRATVANDTVLESTEFSITRDW